MKWPWKKAPPPKFPIGHPAFLSFYSEEGNEVGYALVYIISGEDYYATVTVHEATSVRSVKLRLAPNGPEAKQDFPKTFWLEAGDSIAWTGCWEATKIDLFDVTGPYQGEEE